MLSLHFVWFLYFFVFHISLWQYHIRMNFNFVSFFVIVPLFIITLSKVLEISKNINRSTVHTLKMCKHVSISFSQQWLISFLTVIGSLNNHFGNRILLSFPLCDYTIHCSGQELSHHVIVSWKWKLFMYYFVSCILQQWELFLFITAKILHRSIYSEKDVKNKYESTYFLWRYK